MARNFKFKTKHKEHIFQSTYPIPLRGPEIINLNSHTPITPFIEWVCYCIVSSSFDTLLSTWQPTCMWQHIWYVYYGHSSTQCSQPYAVLNTVDLDRLRELVVNYYKVFQRFRPTHTNIDGNKLVKQTHTQCQILGKHTGKSALIQLRLFQLSSVVKLSVFLFAFHCWIKGYVNYSNKWSNDITCTTFCTALNFSLHDQSV